MWALLVVDGGMWSDPAIYGPFASEDAAHTQLACLQAELVNPADLALFDDEPDAPVVAIVSRMIAPSEGC